MAERDAKQSFVWKPFLLVLADKTLVLFSNCLLALMLVLLSSCCVGRTPSSTPARCPPSSSPSFSSSMAASGECHQINFYAVNATVGTKTNRNFVVILFWQVLLYRIRSIDEMFYVNVSRDGTDPIQYQYRV